MVYKKFLLMVTCACWVQLFFQPVYAQSVMPALSFGQSHFLWETKTLAENNYLMAFPLWMKPRLLTRDQINYRPLFVFTKVSQLQSIKSSLIWIMLSALFFGSFLTSIFAYKKKLTKVSEEYHQTNQALLLKQSELSTQLEVCQQEKQRLQQELEFRNKELTTQTLNLLQKNALMEEVRELVYDFLQNKSIHEGNGNFNYNRLINLIDYSFTLDKEWEDFKLYFERVHEDFFVKLKDRCPELTTGELKLCALIKLNLSMKESATILGISPESVKTARYRLRKKLNLVEEKNLSDFLLSV